MLGRQTRSKRVLPALVEVEGDSLRATASGVALVNRHIDPGSAQPLGQSQPTETRSGDYYSHSRNPFFIA